MYATEKEPSGQKIWRSLCTSFSLEIGLSLINVLSGLRWWFLVEYLVGIQMAPCPASRFLGIAGCTTRDLISISCFNKVVELHRKVNCCRFLSKMDALPLICVPFPILSGLSADRELDLFIDKYIGNINVFCRAYATCRLATFQLQYVRRCTAALESVET